MECVTADDGRSAYIGKKLALLGIYEKPNPKVESEVPTCAKL